MENAAHVFMRNLLNQRKNPVAYLEIGVCEGHSAKAALETNKIHAAILVDTFPDRYDAARPNIETLLESLSAFAGKIFVIRGSSHTVLPMLSGSFDVILVDGDHSEAGCRQDLTDSLKLLSPDGVIVVDDTHHPQHRYILGVVERFAKDSHLVLESYPDIHLGVATLSRQA